MDTATNLQITNEEQLRRSGFTTVQISNLKDLRKLYPLIELVRSKRELDELAFLRWRYRTGRAAS